MLAVMASKLTYLWLPLLLLLCCSYNDPAANTGTPRCVSGTSTSTEVYKKATSSGFDYEVFLSFRGPDTREGFTDFVYTTLKYAGIRVYKDEEDLRKGEEFGPELLQAINQSKISIPILSKGYASSVWCLKELVQMVKCQKTRGQKIMPIFYDVAPAEVRYQTGGYGRAFLLHEHKKRYDEETIRQWKAALKEVSFLNGWDLHNITNRREGAFARKVTREVSNELKNGYLVVSDQLVSVDHHVDEIMEMIGAWTSETRIIGIHGMDGIGKTIIAKIIYNQLLNDFENCCFLPSIHKMSKRKGIEYLQNQLISDILRRTWTDIRNIDEGIKIIKDRLSNKRVLLLLDDVDEKSHMDALLGKRDWFGNGSKVIITTRKKDVLIVPKVDYIYEVNDMDRGQSLQLLSKYAFKRDCPLDQYINQSKKAVDIAGGLPLAVRSIGSLLYRIEKEKWDDRLEDLENVLEKEVESQLKSRYDELDIWQKLIFLDIACLFIGYDKDIVFYFWNEFKIFPKEAMEVLENMSWIKIEDNKLWMCNQLKILGREIVHQESKMKMEKQSRVWNPNEGLDLLISNEEKENVEYLRLKSDHQQHYCLMYENFMRLSNLRFLAVEGSIGNFCVQGSLPRHKLLTHVFQTHVLRENSYLLPQLRWLIWHNISPIFDITIFSLKKLVIVDLSGSNITHDWNGWSHMKVIKNLKVLNLTGCYLERTPNLSAHANLERLILRGCSNLVEIDRSISQLKRLVSLDLRDCPNLRRLPDELGGLEALEELLIDSTLIKEASNFQWMRNLSIVTASPCGISTLPLSTVPEKANSSRPDYEVSLSFRGPDSRRFYRCYTIMIDAGICVYKVECWKTRGQKIMPIFYDVAPSEVRYQTGGYGEAFPLHEHKKRYDEETIRQWKAALKEVSFLNGWDLHDMTNR